MHKQRRSYELGEMRDAQLLRFARRMERIREKDQPINQSGVLSRQHGRLAATVGMSAEEYMTRRLLPYQFHGPPQSFSIARGPSGRWRTKRALLPKRQIDAQYRKARIAKRLCHRDQKLSVTVSARSMRQDQCVPIGICWRVQKTTYVRENVVVNKRLYMVRHR